MKGVLICGGTGSRLKPLTDVTNKSLLPVYDRPLILFPLQVLLDAGIREIMIVTGTEHIDQIAAFLGSGASHDCAFTYAVQEKPGGIAQALGLAEEFVAGDRLCAILGDNVFLQDISKTIRAFRGGGHLFLKEVHDPERFGVVELRDGKPVSIEEKPLQPKSSLAQTGCYLFDHRCFDIIRGLKPSPRGELEITDVSRWYLDHGELAATVVDGPWVDAGTFESFYHAAMLVREKRLQEQSSS
ncbi:MAG: glucose-1-phosphate thymidylyltransferase [Candidatus Peregrinibacteria bacterium Gr01-1014_25]|nr:MAG: glucose-1-phosphate thymidylyltransferase [Candidatus Peregrinibacteria bacterium Gr01-1014_25]